MVPIPIGSMDASGKCRPCSLYRVRQWRNGTSTSIEKLYTPYFSNSIYVWSFQHSSESQSSTSYIILLTPWPDQSITYSFSIPYVKRKWWKWAVILECVETLAVTTCALRLETQAPLELAYIEPFTFQTVAFIAILQASRGLPERSVKHLADYLLTTGSVFSLMSMLILGLSLARFLDRLIYVHYGFFILSLMISLRLTDLNRRPAIAATGHQYLRRFTGRQSRHNSYQSLPARGPTERPLNRPLPPPNAHVSGRSCRVEE
jgi:hypothetical protein